MAVNRLAQALRGIGHKIPHILFNQIRIQNHVRLSIHQLASIIIRILQFLGLSSHSLLILNRLAQVLKCLLQFFFLLAGIQQTGDVPHGFKSPQLRAGGAFHLLALQGQGRFIHCANKSRTFFRRLMPEQRGGLRGTQLQFQFANVRLIFRDESQRLGAPLGIMAEILADGNGHRSRIFVIRRAHANHIKRGQRALPAHCQVAGRADVWLGGNARILVEIHHEGITQATGLFHHIALTEGARGHGKLTILCRTNTARASSQVAGLDHVGPLIIGQHTELGRKFQQRVAALPVHIDCIELVRDGALRGKRVLSLGSLQAGDNAAQFLGTQSLQDRMIAAESPHLFAVINSIAAEFLQQGLQGLVPLANGIPDGFLPAFNATQVGLWAVGRSHSRACRQHQRQSC